MFFPSAFNYKFLEHGEDVRSSRFICHRIGLDVIGFLTCFHWHAASISQKSLSYNFSRSGHASVSLSFSQGLHFFPQKFPALIEKAKCNTELDYSRPAGRLIIPATLTKRMKCFRFILRAALNAAVVYLQGNVTTAPPNARLYIS